MMANSARDPYWRGSVKRETIDHPKNEKAIEDECAACHMPMGERTSNGRLDFDGHLAKDGISCTVCHQITAERLGTPASFNAGFVLAGLNAEGVRQIQGPYAIDAGRRRIMQSVTGYVQVEAPHIKQSELCATCHTLITQAFGPNGEVIGRLPEQMNYQEWQHSAFNAEKKSCQSCHMPRVDGPVRISSVLGEYRDGLSKHLFVGGNAFMLQVFNAYRNDLGVQASSGELALTAQATVRQMQNDTADIAISAPVVSGSRVSFEVDVKNKVGHKFPTGYPARRTWLHVTVRDRSGRAVFESGALNANGSITGNDSDVDGATFEPHYTEITRADQVQIYEAILGDRSNKPTTGLLTATQYLKDNRLLPRGFDKASADPDIAVYGDAAKDADFSGEGDRVRFVVDAPGSGPVTVEAELLYQPIAFRWARNLGTYDAAEPKRFVSYYNELASTSAIVVAKARR